jgi:hypothetical protein
MVDKMKLGDIDVKNIYGGTVYGSGYALKLNDVIPLRKCCAVDWGKVDGMVNEDGNPTPIPN